MGFFGDKVTNAGAKYHAYAFKIFDKKEAPELVEKTDKKIDENGKLIDKDDDVNNVYLYFGDIMLLIYIDKRTKIRVFWNEFDSECDLAAFRRTKRRLLHKLD